MKLSFFWTISFYSVLFMCLLAYLSSGISPSYGVFWAFLSWTIPVLGIWQASIFCVVLFVVYKQGRQVGKLLLSGLACLLFLPFLLATYNPFGNNQLPEKLANNAFSVLSYNVRVFNSYADLEAEKPNSAAHIRAWVAKNEATIQCLQEFYHVKDSPAQDMIQALATKRGYYFHAGLPHLLDTPTGYFGLIILSKYPIIKRGELPFELRNSNYQAGIWADVLRGKDTIRIVNVHLESIVLHGEQSWSAIAASLSYSFSKRATQIKQLTDFVKKTRHKIILVGDFNDLPYSYTYQALKRQLYNAFEVCGAGFGFTHQGVGKFPNWLRIDNQFYGNGLTCLAYQTVHQQQDSDHLPIIAVYK